MRQSCDIDISHHSIDPLRDDVPLCLAAHTTLRVGGPAKRIVTVHSDDHAISVISQCDQLGEPVLILGGGSNILVADEGFDGTVVRMGIGSIDSQVSDCAGATITVGAGVNWDWLVSHAVEQDWVGLEALSGIPGSVGASPVQNIGAYGAEVSQTITTVRTWDRKDRKVSTFMAADCGFGYRSSRFKSEPHRWVILQVGFQFPLGSLSQPIAYPELAEALNIELGQRAELAAVRDAVLTIRRRKGMVLDDTDHDTWSAGSFFTNPILDTDEAARLPDAAPRFPAEDGKIKTSAAWLISHAGFDKGFALGQAALSTKHVLALTNRGGATAADLLALASKVRDRVKATFGIELIAEVNLIGTSLTDGDEAAKHPVRR